MAEPDPPGATWVIRDPDGRVVDYSTEPIRLQMDTLIGEALGQPALKEEPSGRD